MPVRWCSRSRPGRSISGIQLSLWWHLSRAPTGVIRSGQKSGLFKKENHPVVYRLYADALTGVRALGGQGNCRPKPNGIWACGGLENTTEFAWGRELTPDGCQMGQHLAGGGFLRIVNLADGYERTSPVGAFPPIGCGQDMISNV